MGHDCGQYFVHLFRTNILALYKTGFERDRYLGAPFCFGENHFRQFVSCACQNGVYVPPFHWPRLVIERKVPDDSHGGIDYFFVERGKALDTMRNVVATCELKGPTRRVLLEGVKSRWYNVILKDLQKQLGRARRWPHCQNYVAVLIVPLERSDARRDFCRVLDSMVADLQHRIRLDLVFWEELARVERLNLVVMRVLPDGM